MKESRSGSERERLVVEREKRPVVLRERERE